MQVINIDYFLEVLLCPFDFKPLLGSSTVSQWSSLNLIVNHMEVYLVSDESWVWVYPKVPPPNLKARSPSLLFSLFQLKVTMQGIPCLQSNECQKNKHVCCPSNENHSLLKQRLVFAFKAQEWTVEAECRKQSKCAQRDDLEGDTPLYFRNYHSLVVFLATTVILVF